MNAAPGRIHITLAFCEPWTDASTSHCAKAATCCANVCDELTVTTRAAAAGPASRRRISPILAISRSALTTTRGPPSHWPPGEPSARRK